MSNDRLTDDDLADLTRTNFGPDINNALAELRERRAADLSAEEVEALGVLFAFVSREVAMTQAECDALKPGLNVLSKLTKAGR